MHFLGSMRFGLVALALLFAALLVLRLTGLPPTWVLALPLALVITSMVCALVTRPHFRAQPFLLLFHFGLVLLAVLLVVSRLTYFEGGFEVTRGSVFEGALVQHEAGPWHDYRLDRLKLINLAQEVRYRPGPRLAGMRNRVRFRFDGAPPVETTIADVRPLVVGGYRIYVTPNNGFAPVFVWQPDSSVAAQAGSVHLPAFPLFANRQSAFWQPPGTDTDVFVELEFDTQARLGATAPYTLAPPDRHRIVLRHGDRRVELKLGGTATIAGGQLRYVGLEQWMGYRVFYDPAMPWLLASALLAVAGLGLHLHGRLRRRDWRQGPAPLSSKAVSAGFGSARR